MPPETEKAMDNITLSSNQNKKVFGNKNAAENKGSSETKEVKKTEPLKFNPGPSKSDGQGNVFGVAKTGPVDSQALKRKAKADLLFGGNNDNVPLFGGNKVNSTNVFGPGTTTKKPVEQPKKQTSVTPAQGNDLFGAPPKPSPSNKLLAISKKD